MNTGPAVRITVTRRKLAAAVGTSPRKAMTSRVCAEGRGGSPSTISAAGTTMAAAISNNTVLSPIGSIWGKRRISTDEMP